ncbi:conjugative transposon protein TraM [Chryseobacterium pennae]|uniref:Conjugative transposon protein TraM n=1 Tax=Chryseobacterium pennae TaxID=2258962 RepID=A0A3D9C7Z9_9FLAO|nr:conjugative transposon protein TraM [Chryseobacterium pennae]REC61879.1 conjugative transposon protein TraM [Chryseobacterium pennae]
MEEKENNKKRISLIVDDDEASTDNKGKDLTVRERLKKPVIFVLMGIVFIACLYMIFKPKGEDNLNKDNGLKNAVPEASDKGLQADKQKAYEKEMMEERDAVKRNSLMSLSDYWNSNDSNATQEVGSNDSRSAQNLAGTGSTGYQNRSLTSYQNAQSTLGAFYRDDDREKLELRRKVDQLQEKLSEKDVPAGPTMKDQLALMEKSYEMASKYLPTGSQPPTVTTSTSEMDSMIKKNARTLPEKERLATVANERKDVVSMLARDKEGGYEADWGLQRRPFFTVGGISQSRVIKNSIPAKVLETQTVNGEGNVKLRLQETALVDGHTIPKGNIVVAGAKFQGNRLQLKISSIEVAGNILPVEIWVYDVDGQPGLSVPRSDEMNAAGEIAANMSQSSGMNISMSRSTGQQVIGDLSRGLMQGVSGYFSKKLRAMKVTLKAGHQVLLVAKK